MKLKTYVAPNLREALAQVKRDLGAEAVILSTRARRTFAPDSPGSGGEVEVKAALDEPEAQSLSQEFQDHGLSLLHQLRQELGELKKLVYGWLKSTQTPLWLASQREMAGLYQILARKGVADQILHRWLAQVQDLLARRDGSGLLAAEQSLGLLMDFINVVNLWQSPDERSPRFWTFIGPPGVGKTTTIAKLAVQFALKRRKAVGLVSVDSGRWGGAFDPLPLLGKFLDVPFLPVAGVRDLRETLSRLAGLEVVLIDTPGQNLTSTGSRDLMDKLAEMPELEHHLLLDATRSESHLQAALQALSRFPLRSLIITKVDENLDFSGVFNQLCLHRVPVSYLTTGPGIPEDIEEASRSRIVSLLLETAETAPMAVSWYGHEQTLGA